jgi:hypothetical protein
LYTPGPIPAELGQLANLQQLFLASNKLTGTPSLFPLTCLQYYDIGLRSSVKSYQYDSVTCFLYVLTGFCIPPGPIPAELGQLANLAVLDLRYNKLTGTPSFFPLTCLQYYGRGLRSSVKSYQYDSMTCFLYVLTGICIPQVPFRLNWANWQNWSGWVYAKTGLPVLHPSFP